MKEIIQRRPIIKPASPEQNDGQFNPPKDEGKVGYKNPPKLSQFRKGTSGNPAGRPKRNKDLRQAIEREMFKEITYQENGQTKRRPKIDVAITLLFNAGLKGDHKALMNFLKFATMIDKTFTPSDKDMQRYHQSLMANTTEAELDEIIEGALKEMGCKIVPIDDDKQ